MNNFRKLEEVIDGNAVYTLLGQGATDFDGVLEYITKARSKGVADFNISKQIFKNGQSLTQLIRN